ncbi:MAG: Hsp33 family molecular chaperone HslO [Tissierella sp.]|uniref:Hsp33 family molecular chaperone HslO n=1 Tax=Tissierella sp. TaxID=41274 RepID=UPI003F9AEA59
MKDYLIRGTDKLGRIRVLVAKTTAMVEESRKIHNTSPTATAALGRSLTAGVLMGAMMKNEKDVLTFKINGKGPGGNILVVARNNGTIKGEIMHPSVDLPSRKDGKLDVGGLVGNNGTLTIIMDLGLKEPYVGISKLVSGEIAEDLAHYYAYSEQQPSVVSLGVLVDKDISVKAAGGYIIQLLPGCTEEDIVLLENKLKEIKPVSALIDEGLSPEDIFNNIFEDFEMKILEKKDIEYKCDCSKEKIVKVIKGLGKTEINAMIEEDSGAEVMCHFCNTKHKFDEEELKKIMIDI